MWTALGAIAILIFVVNVALLVFMDDPTVSKREQVARTLGFLFVGLYMARDVVLPSTGPVTEVLRYLLFVVGFGFFVIAWRIWLRERRNRARS